MIVLKATQDKILCVLQSIAGIVERRHTLPILANVLIRKTDTQLSELVEAFEPIQTTKVVVNCFWPQPKDVQSGSSNAFLSIGLKSASSRAMSVGPCFVGFFSASKANLRNAP
jgi:hypothetical protein